MKTEKSFSRKIFVCAATFFLCFFITSFLMLPVVLAGDDINDITGKKGHPKIAGVLNNLINKKQIGGMSAAESFAQQNGIDFVNGNARVVFVTDSANTSIASQLATFGVTVGKKYNNLIRGYAPVSSLAAIAVALPGVLNIRLPFTPHEIVTSEGVALTGADVWHTSSHTGAGTKVAVIDLGFNNLTATITNGDLPAGVVTKDYTGTGLETGTVHGTAVSESVNDMAPDAQLYLLKIGDEIDLANAVNDAVITYGVNVINHSVGWVNTGPYNGTGPICDIANGARANGVLWVNAAGNEGGKHYQGVFTSTDADGWHEFTTSPIDELNDIFISGGQTASIFLSWDDWGPDSNNPASDQDYDLFLFASDGTTQVASSEAWQGGTPGTPPVEGLSYTPTSGGNYKIGIYNFATTRNSDMKLFTFRQTLEHRTLSSSLMQPADAAGVLTVGAIDSTKWTTGPQESFSSQGPTTNWSGAVPRTKPDIMGTDNVDSFTYGHWFGTSAASPTVAGAAALVFDRFPSYTADLVQAFLEATAIDMGNTGKDNIYGSGRLNLTDPTYIELSKFIVKQKRSKVIVKWKTATEVDNFGFYILRSESENGEFIRISKFIKAKKNAVSGAKYKYPDRKVKTGNTYYYKLEDVDTSGNSTIHDADKVKISKKLFKKKRRKK